MESWPLFVKVCPEVLWKYLNYLQNETCVKYGIKTLKFIGNWKLEIDKIAYENMSDE